MNPRRTTAAATLALVATAAAGCAPGTGATAATSSGSSPAAVSPSAAGTCTVQINGPTIAGGALLATVTTTCTSGATATGAVSFAKAPAGTSVNTLAGWTALPPTGYWNGMPPTANITAACAPAEWVVVAETSTNGAPDVNTESAPDTISAGQCD